MNIWLLGFSISLLHSGWRIKMIEPSSAKTIIRLWHELHVEKHIAHDFTNMLSPKIDKKEFYVAASRHGDIKAIAHCSRQNCTNASVKQIAHGPNQLDGPIILLEITEKKHNKIYYTIDLDVLKSQNRWYLEALLNKN